MSSRAEVDTNRSADSPNPRGPGAEVRARWLLLSNKDLRLLVAARFVSILGNAATLVSLVFAFDEVGYSVAAVGATLAARQVCAAVGIVVGGSLSDSRSPKSVMVFSDLVAAATQVGVFLVLIGHGGIVAATALVSLSGLASGVFMPANGSLVPRIVDEADLTRANSSVRIANSLATVLGAGIGGTVVGLVGAQESVLIDAVTFALSATLIVAIGRPMTSHSDPERVRRMALPAIAARVLRPGRRSTSKHSHDNAGAVQDDTVRHQDRPAGSDAPLPLASGSEGALAGIRVALGTRWLLIGIAAWSLGTLGWTPFLQLLGPIAVGDKFGASTWSLFFIAISVGLIVGGLVAPRVSGSTMILGFGSMSLLGLPALALGVDLSLLVCLAAAAFAGFGLSFADILWVSQIQRSVPAQTLGRVMAVHQFSGYGLGPLGTSVAAVLSGVFGVQPTLIAAGILSSAAALAVLSPAVRGVDERAKAVRVESG